MKVPCPLVKELTRELLMAIARTVVAILTTSVLGASLVIRVPWLVRRYLTAHAWICSPGIRASSAAGETDTHDLHEKLSDLKDTDHGQADPQPERTTDVGQELCFLKTK